MKILDEEVSYRKKPINIKDEDEYLFEHEYKKQFSPVFISEISECKVLKTGQLFSKNKLYMPYFNISPSWLEIIKSYLYLFDNLACKKSNLDGFFVTNASSLNFFHWHLDVLPKLEVLSIKDKCQIFLPAIYSKGFYKETIDLLYPEITVISLDGCYSFPKLYFFPDTAPSGNYRPSLIRKLHYRILNNEVIKTMNASTELDYSDKIYISRKKAKMRKILNEDSIIKDLERLGFKVLYMEDLSYRQQISYSSRARVILSLHGAGLTHMLYMQPSSKVIEIRAKGDAKNNCYYSLASELHHDYYYLTAIATQPNKATQATDFVLPDDFIDQLEKILNS